MYQFDFEEGDNFEEIRKDLQRKKEEFGPEYLHNLLKQVDPASAEIIHVNDTKKTTRALEIFYTTGQKKSEGKNEQQPLYPYILFVLNRDRQKLYEDINKRVDIMMEQGLLDEVKNLYDTLPHDCQSLKGIGYKELIPYFNGECELNEAVEMIKQHSRNYAKRQLTWFRKNPVLKEFCNI